MQVKVCALALSPQLPMKAGKPAVLTSFSDLVTRALQCARVKYVPRPHKLMGEGYAHPCQSTLVTFVY